MNKAVDFTIVRTRNELLSLKNEENIQISKSWWFKVTDLLWVIQKNPRLKRIGVPVCVSEYMKKDIRIMQLLDIRSIELIVKNIIFYHKEKGH